MITMMCGVTCFQSSLARGIQSHHKAGIHSDSFFSLSLSLSPALNEGSSSAVRADSSSVIHRLPSCVWHKLSHVAVDSPQPVFLAPRHAIIYFSRPRKA